MQSQGGDCGHSHDEAELQRPERAGPPGGKRRGGDAIGLDSAMQAIGMRCDQVRQLGQPEQSDPEPQEAFIWTRSEDPISVAYG